MYLSLLWSGGGGGGGGDRVTVPRCRPLSAMERLAMERSTDNVFDYGAIKSGMMCSRVYQSIKTPK